MKVASGCSGYSLSRILPNDLTISNHTLSYRVYVHATAGLRSACVVYLA